MRWLAARAGAVLYIALVGGGGGARGDESEQVSFVRQAAPILLARCQSCHGPETAESNYRLDTFELLMTAGDHGTPPVTAGELDDSELYRLIVSDDADERMPNNGDRLSDAEIRTIAQWIKQGAQFDGEDPEAALRSEIPRDLPHPPAPEVYPVAIPVTAIAFTPDGGRLLVGGYHEILVHDLASGRIESRLGNVPQRVLGLCLSPDGQWLAVAGGAPGVSGEVRIVPWPPEPDGPRGAKVLGRSDDVFFDAAFSPDGKELAAAGADGLVRVFDVESGALRLSIENHADWVNDLCYSPDGKSIATASRDKTAKVFAAAGGALLATYAAHEAPVRAVAFAPDGASVLSAGGQSVRQWKIEDASLMGELAGFPQDVYGLIASGDRVVAGSADGSIRVFKLSDRSLVRTLVDQGASIVSLAEHEGSHRLCSGCYDGTTALWDLDAGNLVLRFNGMPVAPATASAKP